MFLYILCTLLTICFLWLIIAFNKIHATNKLLQQQLTKQTDELSDQKKSLENLTHLYQQFCVLNYMVLQSDLKKDLTFLEKHIPLDDKIKQLLSLLNANIDETEKIRKKLFDN